MSDYNRYSVERLSSGTVNRGFVIPECDSAKFEVSARPKGLYTEIKIERQIVAGADDVLPEMAHESFIIKDDTLYGLSKDVEGLWTKEGGDLIMNQDSFVISSEGGKGAEFSFELAEVEVKSEN